MRELTSHKVNFANDTLMVEAIDEPGHGGASHAYRISGPADEDGTPAAWVELNFQNGPINEVGVNGITHEALLAILIDRIEGFEGGPFSNHWNGIALDHLRIVQSALLERTRKRMARGVEGTHKV